MSRAFQSLLYSNKKQKGSMRAKLVICWGSGVLESRSERAMGASDKKLDADVWEKRALLLSQNNVKSFLWLFESCTRNSTVQASLTKMVDAHC
jgi:hypothetical protein